MRIRKERIPEGASREETFDMDANDLFLPTLGLCAVALTMGAGWWNQRHTRNAGIVDVLWAGSLGALALFYAAAGDGWLPRRVLVGVLAGFWSARLTWHLAARFRREPEDGRYATLRYELGSRADAWFFFFFQAQALLAVGLSLAFLLPATDKRVGWSGWELIAVLVWILSVVGESAADRQLKRWRGEPGNIGRTCRAGLWRWSRHPNYFFEWIHWCAYPLLAIGQPFGWTLWLVPAVMLFLILKVTGIPPTEARALETRGDDYRAYQRTTNAFFPGPTRAVPSPLPSPPKR